MFRKNTEEVSIIRTESYNIINYVYLLVDKHTKEAALIDPSWNYNKILEKIDMLNVDVTAVFLTHSHIDHVNLADKIAHYTKAKVYISEKEAKTYGFQCHNLETLKNGDIVEVGTAAVKAMLTPGHTKGSMCYLTDSNFFTGDTVFIEGCGLCNDTLTASEMFDSIQNIKHEVNQNVMVYPGHYYERKYGFSLAEVMEYNIYFQIDHRQTFIDFRMRNGQKNLFKFI